MNTMEYGKAFAYFTEDPDWIKKFLIAAFVPLIPILGGFLLVGYSLEVTRRVIKNESPVLPEWNDFGDFLKKGFFGFLIGLVYTLPIILIAACLSAPGIALQTQDDSNLQMAGTVIAVCASCVIAIVSVFVSLLVPAAMSRFAATGELSAGLRVGDAFALLRTKPGIYLISALILGVIAVPLVLIGMVACGIGTFVVAGYLNLVAAHLHGQAYRVAATEAGLS